MLQMQALRLVAELVVGDEHAVDAAEADVVLEPGAEDHVAHVRVIGALPPEVVRPEFRGRVVVGEDPGGHAVGVDRVGHVPERATPHRDVLPGGLEARDDVPAVEARVL